MGCPLWGCTESDTLKQLSSNSSEYFYSIIKVNIINYKNITLAKISYKILSCYQRAHFDLKISPSNQQENKQIDRKDKSLK